MVENENGGCCMISDGNKFVRNLLISRCDDSLWRLVNLSARRFASGVLGNILVRGPTAIKLSRAKIDEPVFIHGMKRTARTTARRNGANKPR